jgi:hypothetical protein
MDTDKQLHGRKISIVKSEIFLILNSLKKDL